MTSYIRDTSFAATLGAAMGEFHRALTYRWRLDLCEAIERNHPFIPTPVASGRLGGVTRVTAPHLGSGLLQPAWSYSTLEARAHIDPGGCRYLAWARSNRSGDLSAVHCDGHITDPVVIDPRTQAPVAMPRRIECGVGKLLRQVEDWAWLERARIFTTLPLFDHHDIEAIHQAYDDLVTIAYELGLHPDTSDADTAAALRSTGPEDLTQIVPVIAVKDGEGQTWWVHWTGLAADVVKSGFFASVTPTMNNQRDIAAALAILYSVRAAIIEKGRCDTLSWIEWATRALYQTRTVVTDLTRGWRAAQGIGQLLSLVGKARILSPVGAATVLAGFLAEDLLPEVRHVVFAHTADEVLAVLDEKVEALHSELDALEEQFDEAVKRLRREIYATHSFNLELYDLTRNNPEGRRRDTDGYSVDVDDILRLAERCYKAAEGYQGLLPRLTATCQADRHLAGRDGRPTRADVELLEVRDQFEQFLRTTCARYLLAADQVRRAAQAYAEAEESQRTTFNTFMARWDSSDVGQVDVGCAPTLAAAGTGANVPRVESLIDLHRTWEALKQRRAQAEEYVVEDE